MPDRILAADPGNMSGLAFGEFWAGRDPVVEVWELEQQATLEKADQMLSGRGVSFVVCESFVPRPGVRTWQPAALEIIGALRWLCWQHKTQFAIQSPADAKRFATDDKLKTIGWWTPTKGGHANDAYRHLLLAAVRGGAVNPAIFVA